jgi:hypothetical protein
MPLRRCGQPLRVIGFRGVRWWSYGNWTAELTTGGERVWLGTFNNPEEKAHLRELRPWLDLFLILEESS